MSAITFYSSFPQIFDKQCYYMLQSAPRSSFFNWRLNTTQLKEKERKLVIDRNAKKGRLENLHVFTAFITENPKLATLKSKQQMNPFFIKAGKVDCVILGLIIQIRLRVHITVWMGFSG